MDIYSLNRKNNTKPRLKIRKPRSFLSMCLNSGAKNMHPIIFPKKSETRKN